MDIIFSQFHRKLAKISHRETLHFVSNANWLESEVMAAYLLKAFEDFSTGIDHAFRNELAPDRMAASYTINITFCGERDETFNLDCRSLENAIEECKELLNTLVLMAWDNDLWGDETYLACKKVAKNISITPDSSVFDIEKYLKEESVRFCNEKYKDLQGKRDL